jgi:aryl sulfotransferase
MPIWWLVSYPKSGNTWLRAFLTNYLKDANQPADINELCGSGEAISRDVFDEVVGIESASLTADQIDCYRPQVYSTLSAHGPEPWYWKIHDSYRINAAGRPVYPREGTCGVLYMIRNPLDVAVSYAHHRNRTIDDTIDWMGNESATTDGYETPQLRQILGSWSSHVASWTGHSEPGFHLVRYEDMAERPEETFTGILRYMGECPDIDRLRRALAFSSFDRLRIQEIAHEFRERPPTAPNFFRAGRAGSWRSALCDQQVKRLVSRHREVMARFGYSDAGG